MTQQLSFETAVCPTVVKILAPLQRPQVVKESKNTRGYDISEMGN